MSDPLEHDDDLGPPRAVAASAAPWLEALNDSQRAAVEALDGPVLVLAGAGTGKTRVLTTRLAQLLYSGRCRPYEVLAVTFTNKAAREMRTRVATLIGPPAESVWLGTFHALAARILRRHAELVGLKSNFTILDADDQIRLLKQLLEAEGVDDKRWPARALMHVIQRWKDKGLMPDKVPSGEAGDFANGRAIKIYAAYQERLSVLNAADFGDLLLLCLTLFMQNADVLQEYQRRFRYILVDEYQDTNVAQYLWLRLLAQGDRNICCVGDDDQSIYGWRGAEVGNILRFEKDFPGAKVIRLERNYRSTPHILGAASGLIAHNEGRLGKTLWTEEEAGDKVSVRGLWDGEEEARWVADEIEALHRAQHSLDEVAILVRAGFQTREFEERFVTLGIPYRVIGGPRFYEREEIRDAIAYLRVVHQPDDDLAFERIVNKPTRGIGKTTLQSIHILARTQGWSMWMAAARLIETDELKPAARRALTAILELFRNWRAMADGIAHTDLAETILDESDYTAFWQASKKPEAPGKLENLKELIVAMEEFESLAGFLEHVSLVMENEEANPGEQVSIMTLHAAKGLEFQTVFLPGWEEGLFPHQRAMDESGAAGLEEERRLAYVGLTRAKQKVQVSYAANRRVHGQWTSSIPSRFVGELPDEHVDAESAQGLFGGGYGVTGGGMHAVAPDNQASYGGDRFRGGGPGWRRLQSRGPGSRGPVTIDGEAEVVQPAGDGFGPGDRCFHQKFGPGTVRLVTGDHLTIVFDKAGEKKVVAAFVEKA